MRPYKCYERGDQFLAEQVQPTGTTGSRKKSRITEDYSLRYVIAEVLIMLKYSKFKHAENSEDLLREIVNRITQLLFELKRIGQWQ